ncbi:MAG: ABC transporter substrate-binding protein [Fermentimonas sp.]|jgi:iron complex transport system substrate-binding protein
MNTLKKKINKLFFAISLILFTFFGCVSKHDSKGIDTRPIDNEEIKYSKGFTIDYFDNYTKVTVLNPWTKYDEAYHVYYLYKGDKPNNLPYSSSKESVIKIPLTSVSVNTFAYFEFLNLIDELGTVKGVTDGFRIYNPTILKNLASGDIVDLGDPFNPNIEKTIALKPQASINSAYAQVDSYSDRIAKLGIPIIYSIEWMENNPLARAEWIKLIAAFYDKQQQAREAFDQIEQKYLQTKALTENISQKIAVLSGDIFQDTWYVPGGQSFNAELFRDAGLNYYLNEDKSSGSIGLDIESVLTTFNNADLWIGCDAKSYKELGTKDSKYMLINAVKKHNVYNNLKRTTTSGGNDYFEGAIANPHLVLSDIIKVAYPELLPDYSLTYIKPLD